MIDLVQLLEDLGVLEAEPSVFISYFDKNKTGSLSYQYKLELEINSKEEV
ncbi:hypothetical protein SAMN06295926_1225 [Lysinibacillus sp. AC-3]|nr:MULTISPECIES: hypothetical protein [unclassified Lysinibacillus]SKC08860.1 hypothetical protein SAMN06295926_1225 [Lysinibacillus sp. AC-3]